jgi:hypothetical protein
MFMQAWGNYGTTWAVVHQWLGVRPDLGNRRIEVVPQVPQGQTTVQGRDIRLGGGSADVRATHVGDAYRTRIDVGKGVGAHRVVIGHTLPAGARPATVVLDGRRVHDYRVRATNRGTEVTVPTTAGHHILTITT